MTMERGLKEQMKELASHDDLTGCLNYRQIMRKVEEEISRSQRNQKPLTLVLIDLDNFKEINDLRGHLQGNAALKQFAEALQANVRIIDSVARYGGDEFLLLLPDASPQQALAILERIRSVLKATPIELSESVEGKACITIAFSAGVTAYGPERPTIEKLIGSADAALFQAKKEGKSRVVVQVGDQLPA